MNLKFLTSLNQTKRTYRSKDGRHYFWFEFHDRGSYIDVYCNKHPSLGGRSSNAHKTHLYSSGKVCFASGREPRSISEAHRRAQQWAEYFLEYIRTGKTQK